MLRGHRATTGHAGGGRDDVAPPRRPSLRAPPPPRGVCARHPPSHRCPTCCCVILKRMAHLQEVVDDAQQLRSSASRFRARMWGGDVNGHSSALVTFVRRESAPAWKLSSCGGPASGAREGGGRAPSARALGTRCGRQAAPATLRSASDHRRRGRTRAPSALRRCARSVFKQEETMAAAAFAAVAALLLLPEAERLELHHGRGEGRQGHAQRFPVL